jgi:hypothetical protein
MRHGRELASEVRRGHRRRIPQGVTCRLRTIVEPRGHVIEGGFEFAVGESAVEGIPNTL